MKNPRDYIWSSYRFFVSRSRTPNWLSTDAILSYFDKDTQKARTLYKTFVLEGIGKPPLEISDNLNAGFLLGDNDFVGWIKETFINGRKEDSEIPALRRPKTKITPERIREIVEEEIGDRKLARKLAIYLSRKYTGRKLKEIASIYGAIGDTGISQVYRRVKETRARDKKLDDIVTELEKQIKM